MADIEELDQDKDDNDLVVEVNEESSVNSITSTRFLLERHVLHMK